jgi:hypothetical protein
MALAYLNALGDETESRPLLLNDQELDHLAETFEGGPLEFDRPWAPYEPLHSRSIDCVLEIKGGLASEYADSWARASARFTETLEGGRVRLGDGVQIVREWIAKCVDSCGRWASLHTCQLLKTRSRRHRTRSRHRCRLPQPSCPCGMPSKATTA